MKPDCKYFREYEEAAYVRGYKDGLTKAIPQVVIPESKKRNMIENSRFLIPLEYATNNSNGLTGEELMNLLKISRGTFYAKIKTLILQKKVIKIDKERPVRFIINRNPDKTFPLI